MPAENRDKPLVILLCTGLGGVRRGFETYMHQLATDLHQQGKGPVRYEVWSAYPTKDVAYRHRRIPAVSRFNRLLGLLTRSLHARFHAEQQTMVPGLLWQLLLQRPAAIYLGEYQLYCYLFKLRSLLGLQWSLCLHTGGQAIPGLFRPQLDWVHHITNRFWDEAVQRGIPAGRQFLLPHPLADAPMHTGSIPLPLQQAAGKFIVLSVGSLDETVKGMVTLARALAPFANQVFPVFLGEPSPQTPQLLEVLKGAFGNQFYTGQMPHQELPAWYRAAHVVVSCSRMESFGLVLLEALLQETAVMCFRWPGAEWVFGSHACYFVGSGAEAIGREIMDMLEEPASRAKNPERRYYVQQRFGWQALEPAYLRMFAAIAAHEKQA